MNAEDGQQFTPEEIRAAMEEMERNAPTQEAIDKMFAQYRIESAQYDEAIRQAESGLNTLQKMIWTASEGMAASAARELLRILNNSLLAFNTPKGRKCIVETVDRGQKVYRNEPVMPEILVRLAEKNETWPVLYYAHSERQKIHTEDIINALRLGEELGFNVRDGKSFYLWSPANLIVLELARFIERYRGEQFNGEASIALGDKTVSSTQNSPKFRALLKSFAALPRLSREPNALRAWQAAGNALIPFLYGKSYERHLQLIALWRGKKTKLVDSLSESNSTPGVRRGKIREAIRDAWESVAKEPKIAGE